MIKVIFSCGKLKIGGVQKSLISLLNSLDLNKYEVTLLLDDLGGDLFKQVPNNIKLVPLSEEYKILHQMNLRSLSSYRYICRHFTLIKLLLKYIFSNNRYTKKHLISDMYLSIKDSLDPLFKHEDFDFAISYAGGIGIWNQIVIDQINAKRKFCWIHGDYTVFGTGEDSEKEYIKQFDKVVAVSETAKGKLLSKIPELVNQTMVIHNIIKKEQIFVMSNKDILKGKNVSGVKFISIARLDKGKGFDLAIKAFDKAVKSGHNLSWDIIGEGYEKNTLLKLINERGLEDNVRLLGKKINPYPYLRNADIFFHPSKGEGKSISVDEAKVMAKPILITAYPTVHDQIQDDLTGKIVPITLEGLYEGIIEMASNEELRNQLHNNLLQCDFEEDSVSRFEYIMKLDTTN